MIMWFGPTTSFTYLIIREKEKTMSEFMCFVAGIAFAYAACREGKLGIIKLPGIDPGPDKIKELEEKINKLTKLVEKLQQLLVEMAKKATPALKPKPEPTAPNVEAKQGNEASEAGTTDVAVKS